MIAAVSIKREKDKRKKMKYEIAAQAKN